MLEKLKRPFPLLSLAFVLCLTGRAQEVVYVQGQQDSQQLDIRNVKEIRVEPGALTADFGSLYLQMPFDTLSFVATSQEMMCMGWWGDIDEGESVCYYWPDTANVPNVKLCSTSGCCDAVRGYFRVASNRHLQPRRVGGKWRYTLGTLTGRRRVHLSCFTSICYEHYNIYQREDNPDYNEADMTMMFEGKPSRVVSNVLDYWHLPLGCHAMPESPVFGDFDGWRYEIPLVDDSLTVVVSLIPGRPDVIVGDTMQLVFRDASDAQRAYSEIGTTGDEDITVSLYNNLIYIIEKFEATAEEVRQWVVRFDLDLYKPLFLRDDE